MVRISEWLSEGWALVKDDIVTFAVAALLAGVIGAVTAGICMAPLMVGLYMMAFAKMKGEPVAIGDVFKGFQKFGPAFVASLLIVIAAGVVGVVLNLIPVVGQIAASLLGFAVGAATFYTMQLIAVSDISPVEAIQQSFEKVKDNFLMYCLAAFLFGLVNSVGAAICGIGALVTMPIVVMAGALAYRDNFAMPGGAAQPNFSAPAVPVAPVAPAPPTAMPTPEPPKPEPPTQ